MKKIVDFCKICLNHNEKKYDLKEKIRSRPSSFVNGMCQVCDFEIKKKQGKIDWKKRKKILNKLVLEAKKNKSSIYDCIIPVSGGKDSFRQAMYVRDVLGLNPLLVSLAYPPEQLTTLGAQNFSNLVSKGFDCVSLTLDPVKWKELMKHGFLKFCNCFRSSEMALYAAPIHFALNYDIRLIFYGENFLYTVAHGTPDEGSAWDATNLYFGGNTTKGGTPSLKYKKASKLDYFFYDYPDIKKVKNQNYKIIYLGYFLDDWYGNYNGKYAKKRGMKIRKDSPKNTGDLWGYSGLDEDLRIVNQHLKYLKRGYGYVTDQVCESIHQGIIDRNEAIKLVKKYDGQCHPKYIDKFCKYLSISKKEYSKVVDKFVNRVLFEKKNNKWIRKFEIF